MYKKGGRVCSFLDVLFFKWQPDASSTAHMWGLVQTWGIVHHAFLSMMRDWYRNLFGVVQPGAKAVVA